MVENACHTTVYLDFQK